MKDKSDKELMEMISLKQPAAMEELYYRYFKMVYSFVFKFCNSNAEKTKEISQTIFLKLWSTDSCYDDSKGDFANWLLTVARNVCIDQFRRETAMKRDPEFHRLSGETGRSNEIDDLINNNEIFEAKKCLTPAQLRTINLFYWKGYSLTEISQIEDEPVGTIKSRLHQSLVKLRKQIGEEEWRFRG